MCRCVAFKCSTIASLVSATLNMTPSIRAKPIAEAARQGEARRRGVEYAHLLHITTPNFRYHVISKRGTAVEGSLAEFTNKLGTHARSTPYLTIRCLRGIRPFCSTPWHSEIQIKVESEIVNTFGFSQFYRMQEKGYQFATICSSNVNRSMEAHSLFQVGLVGHLDVRKTISASVRTERVEKSKSLAFPRRNLSSSDILVLERRYGFGTEYETILNDLIELNKDLYPSAREFDLVSRNERLFRCCSETRQ